MVETYHFTGIWNFLRGKNLRPGLSGALFVAHRNKKARTEAG
ncbi:hypothetical protein RCH13_002750 [Chryseobacterium sp. MP_3.2]|nr:hypothetical protein [Chryseobacterium sp. MP_3.2]